MNNQNLGVVAGGFGKAGVAYGGSDLMSAIRPGIETVARAPGIGAGREAERVTGPACGVPTIRRHRDPAQRDPGREHPPQLCLATMERYIEHDLRRPELDAAMLGRAFASSRPRLYDLFREHGGVERYLRQRRLARCFRDLAAADPGCGRVKGVARRWGFRRLKMKRLSFATLAAVALSATSLTPAAFAQEEMRCSHQLPPAHHIARVIDRWAEEVETLSEGEIDVQIFGADSLVGAEDNIIAVAKGDIECAFSVNFQWGKTLPIMNVTLAPYAFNDLDLWRKWPESEAAAFLSEKLLEKGVRNVAWLFETSTSVFTSNNKPLVAPEDFQGMKIRGLVPAFNAALEALGASPVSMPGSEAYQALATGVIDGGLTDVAAAVSRKYYEVQKYFTVTPVISVYLHGYVNPRWYDGLSDKSKAALDEAGKKAAGWAIEASEEAVAAAPDQLREKGVDVHVATDDENAALEAVMRPAFDKAFSAEDPDSQKLIELLGQL
jgi:TRAP-type C4-dicarboxylate transport system substrate-binding protein